MIEKDAIINFLLKQHKVNHESSLTETETKIKQSVSKQLLKKKNESPIKDSMLNNISEKGLSKTHKVRVINFSGGTSEKIADQLDEQYEENFRKVSKDSPSTQLAFSSIIVRKDKKNLEKSIIETNARLKNNC